MIITVIPYCPEEKEKDLGYAYNQAMERVNDDDWICFLDHDAMFTTPDWYKQMEEIIRDYPDGGIYTVYTNRIGCPWMIAPNVDVHIHDQLYHRKKGKEISDQYWCQIEDKSDVKFDLMSGVVILTSKKTWKEVGGFKGGFLGVDNDYHVRMRKHNKRVILMKGIYVYHWYRDSFVNYKK